MIEVSEIRVDVDVCTGCRECERACLYGAITVVGGVARVDQDACTLCGACVEACSEGAISELREAASAVAPPASGVWVFVETTADGLPDRTALELLTEARQIASRLGEETGAVVVTTAPELVTTPLSVYGADAVYLISARPEDVRDEAAVAAAVSDLAELNTPSVILIGATDYGRSLAPRIAARLRTGLTADCTQLHVDPVTRLLVQTRPAFSGNLMAEIVCPLRRPQMATVRPGVFAAVPLKSGSEAAWPNVAREGVATPALSCSQVRVLSCPDLARVASGVRIVRSRVLHDHAVDLESAEVIVAGGMGMRSPAGFALVERLASLLGGAVGASRAAVDAGFSVPSCQIGQTGRTVSPKVYVALGISGAVQHCVGIRGAQMVIAINEDPSAAIFQVADVGIVARVENAVPRLIELLERRQGKQVPAAQRAG